MINALASSSALDHRRRLESEWTWRERTGVRVRPADMDTRHLFYTLRMIWNHAMPLKMEVGRNVRRYVFGPFYSARYMREAILRVGGCLFSRDDIAPWMLTELAQIRTWLASQRRLTEVSK